MGEMDQITILTRRFPDRHQKIGKTTPTSLVFLLCLLFDLEPQKTQEGLKRGRSGGPVLRNEISPSPDRRSLFAGLLGDMLGAPF